jgi:hypothetical protein
MRTAGCIGTDMKARIRKGDRVVIAEGYYWPHSKYGTVVDKEPITYGSGYVMSHWYIVQQDGLPLEDARAFPRAQIEKVKRNAKQSTADKPTT